MGKVIAALVLLFALATAAPATAMELVGSMHEHSGYSDGWPGSRPADYYASGKGFGLDFMLGSDHSDTLALPIVASDYCTDDPTPCALADPVNPADSFRKWDATAEQAAAATTDSFTAGRGFEWTSDRFGHINVYFSRNYSNAKLDGGYADMATFWQSLATGPDAGGFADGVATFNHPGAKKLSDSDPGFNWDDFAYIPANDQRMVGIEVFNDADDYGSWYPHALDKGWHLGAVGAEDLGHRKSDDWGGPRWAKTVIDATDRSPGAIKAALLARHFYAVRDRNLRLSYSVNGQEEGARLQQRAGDKLDVDASVSDPRLTLELVTSGGKVVASGTGALHVSRAADPGERYYFVRARDGDRPMAYSSPVWVEAQRAPLNGARWLAGDLHVHTCFSHDAYCGPDDDNTGIDEAYTFGLPVEARFAEASVRGLDFLAITDHNDVRSSSDPGFGTHGVVGIPAYENSLHGHAQMLGARHLYPADANDPASVNAAADALRADGGVFQINHPVARGHNVTDCSARDLDWGYGYDVVPDTLEVWNLATPQMEDATAWWECWLDRGVHLPATGGSDSHWASIDAVSGAGNPTTWVLSTQDSEKGVLDGLRAGRTSITRLPPAEGGAPLLLEADANHDGTYEAVEGDTVPPGTPMRVRTDGPVSGLVRVRANDQTLVDDAPLPVTFAAPDKPGWVRAEMRLTPKSVEDTLGCTAIPGAPDPTPCAGDQVLAALTSPIYVGKADAPTTTTPPPPGPTTTPPPPAASVPSSSEPPPQSAPGAPASQAAPATPSTTRTTASAPSYTGHGWRSSKRRARDKIRRSRHR
jgi:hypothetical protein